MAFDTLSVHDDRGVRYVTLNRPAVRNAMSFDMVKELQQTFTDAEARNGIRAVVLRGAEGNFCAGGDIKDMARSRSAQVTEDCDPVAAHNREFGRMLQQVNQSPLAVIVLLEGAVLGGGFGLACVSDIAIADANCQFGLPETGLGLPPAQIAPFVVQRIGLTAARRLGVTGGRFSGSQAQQLGLVHEVAESADAMDELLERELTKVRRCAPGANAMTKQIMMTLYGDDLDPALDHASRLFARAVRGDESTEGMTAFIEKRRPTWADQNN